MTIALPQQAVAIIGMAGRFPGAGNIDQFWQNLCDGVESIVDLDKEDMLASGVDPATLDDPHFVRRMGLLDGIDQFDAAFFGYSRREAAVLDPQQRLFLQCAWHALEHAGYDPKACPGAVGVYAGAGMNRYLLHHLCKHPGAVEKLGELELLLGGEKDFLATRVAYKLNLKGPAVTVLTACSTSLTAVVTAYQSLISNGCDMALAGGVAVHVPTHCGYLYQEGGTLSPDGSCRAFDADAKGMVPGDGVAIVVLKRLEDAVRDRDTIYAVIRGAAINNDGSGKIGYTAPSAEGQAKAISMAHKLAGIDPRTIGYVEAHGTGTELGDPIEIAGLSEAFGTALPNRSVAIGSVKTNIGHLDAAAGVTGFIKTVLSLHHGKIAPTLHFKSANPKLGLDRTPFYVNTALTDWPRKTDAPRRAGVSSFGIGGTNAHVVLEEAPYQQSVEDKGAGEQLLLLSARTESALMEARKQLSEHLRISGDALSIEDVAHTLRTGRSGFNHRIAIPCRDRDDAIASLLDAQAKSISGVVGDSTGMEIAMLFPGQGSQHIGMARGIYQSQPVFRDEVDRCCQILKPQLGVDLRTIMWPAVTHEPGRESRLDETHYAQPALFVIEYALAKLLMSWGIKPAAMLGHSIGEYVAACLANVFSLDDALKIVSARGKLMQAMPAGAMLAVQFPAARVAGVIEGTFAIAVVNDASSCVVAGPCDRVDSLKDRLDREGIACRRLRTSHAFHSPMMQDVVAPFEAELANISLRAPSDRILSNLTGTWLTDSQAVDPKYWSAHLRHTVQFNQCVDTLLDSSRRRLVLIEVGPGATLTSIVQRHEKFSSKHIAVSACRHPKQSTDDRRQLNQLAGQLWVSGAAIDWKSFEASDTPRRRVALPGYPFETERHWLSDLFETGTAERSQSSREPQTLLYQPTWRQSDRLIDQAQLKHAPKRWLICCNPGQRESSLASALLGVLRELDQQFHLAEMPDADAASVAADIIVDLCDAGATDSTAIVDQAARSTVRVQQLCRLVANQRGDARSITLLQVVSGLHSVAGEPVVAPASAAALAAARAAAREIPQLNCRAIDISGSEAADLIVAEALIDEPHSPVAIRGRRRFVQDVAPIDASSLSQSSPNFVDEGCYLITGGLGGIGLALAEALVQRYRARVALVSRTALPAREDWEWILKESTDRSVCERIEAVQRIESNGQPAVLLTADVAVPDAVRIACDRAVEHFGRIDGVIHAAGIAPGGSLMFRGEQDIRRVLEVKINGADALINAVNSMSVKPKFVALCSSLASMIGVAGQIDYCAANGVLDAMAQQRESQRNLRIVSINWDTWSDTGMAARAAEKGRAAPGQLEALAAGLTTAQGVEAFFLALATPWPQIIASARPVAPRLKQERPAVARTPAVSSERAEEKPSVPNAAHREKPPMSIAERIQAVWKEFLGVKDARGDDDFFELGGHSLLAVQIVHRLQETFDIELGPDAVFQAPTLTQLTAHIESLIATKPIDDPSADRLLAMVESLTDEQVQALLEQELSGQR